LEAIHSDQRVILKWNVSKQDEWVGMRYVHLAQDWDKWWVAVSMTMMGLQVT
jgi:hypothetical protein